MGGGWSNRKGEGDTMGDTADNPMHHLLNQCKANLEQLVTVMDAHWLAEHEGQYPRMIQSLIAQIDKHFENNPIIGGAPSEVIHGAMIQLALSTLIGLRYRLVPIRQSPILITPPIKKPADDDYPYA